MNKIITFKSTKWQNYRQRESNKSKRPKKISQNYSQEASKKKHFSKTLEVIEQNWKKSKKYTDCLVRMVVLLLFYVVCNYFKNKYTKSNRSDNYDIAINDQSYMILMKGLAMIEENRCFWRVSVWLIFIMNR